MRGDRPGAPPLRLSALHVLLKREGYVINHKKLCRLYREKRLAVRRRGSRKRAIGTRAPMTVAMAPNDRWLLDFVSISSPMAAASASSLWSMIAPASAWRWWPTPRSPAPAWRGSWTGW